MDTVLLNMIKETYKGFDEKINLISLNFNGRLDETNINVRLMIQQNAAAHKDISRNITQINRLISNNQATVIKMDTVLDNHLKEHDRIEKEHDAIETKKHDTDLNTKNVIAMIGVAFISTMATLYMTGSVV